MDLIGAFNLIFDSFDLLINSLLIIFAILRIIELSRHEISPLLFGEQCFFLKIAEP